MQFKALIAALFLSTLAMSNPIHRAERNSTPPPIPAGQCNTGPVQCCNSVQAADSSAVAALLGLLGVSVGAVTGLVGVTCSPISIIGLPGNSCSAQPVCCSNNAFNGVIALGCTPINLNL